MAKYPQSSWPFLAAMSLAMSPVVSLRGADEVIVDQGRQNVREVVPAPAPVQPAAPDAKPQEPADGDDVKPAEVDLAVPGAKPADPAAEAKPPAGNVKPVAKRPTGKIPLVSKVTGEISKEARKGWAAEQDWPHKEADHSSREETALMNRQLIATLMKRQDNHAAVDGYVRWQLLSYAPDLSEAKPQELRQMISTMPELTRLPVPPQPRNVLKGGSGGAYFFGGVQRAFLSDLTPVAGARGYNPTLGVVNGGTGLTFETPEEIIEKSRSAAYDHVKSRPVIERLNVPTINYRNGLISLMPSEGGLKLEALFADMRDRIEAGDPSYKDACQAFFDEAFKVREDTTIGEKTRAQLVFQMRNLAMKRTMVLKDIEINQAGDMKVAREAVAFPKQHLDTLLTYLRGPVKTE